jgi:DNA-binding MarR family transcriptional regulator
LSLAGGAECSVAMRPSLPVAQRRGEIGLRAFGERVIVEMRFRRAHPSCAGGRTQPGPGHIREASISISGHAAFANAPESEAPRLRLESHLPHALGAASIAVGRLISRAYQDRFGLSVIEWRLMALLAEIGPAPELVVFAGAATDRPVARRAMKALVKRGVAEAGPAGLALTDEGRRLYAEIAPLALAWEDALVTGFSPGEVTALKHLLKRLRAAAERLGGEGG